MNFPFPKVDGKPTTRTFARLLYDCKHHGWSGHLTSGKRSKAKQLTLYLAYLSKLRIGKPAWANPADPPWKSRHCKVGWRCAVDVTEPDEFMQVAQLRHWPVTRPHPNEDWHVEFSRKPVNTQKTTGRH